MPGTTSLGIRYPLQGEVITAQQYEDMADDIDALLTSLDALRDITTNHPSAAVSGGSVSTASGANGFATFTTVVWDTGGYANLGVSPSQLTVPSGIYWAVCEATLTGATTVSAKRVAIIANGVAWGAQTVDTISGTGNGSYSPSSGLFWANGVTNAVQVGAYWTGTGGPATTQSVDLRVYKIRELADL